MGLPTFFRLFVIVPNESDWQSQSNEIVNFLTKLSTLRQAEWCWLQIVQELFKLPETSLHPLTKIFNSAARLVSGTHFLLSSLT